jgi:hypothetical protein
MIKKWQLKVTALSAIPVNNKNKKGSDVITAFSRIAKF